MKRRHLTSKLLRAPKRLLSFFVCALVALSCAASASLAFADDGKDTLTVGVPADRCPVFYQDADTKEIVGIGVDLMRIAAEDAGYDVTFKVVGEATLKDALDSDEYDVVMPFGSAIDSASGHATVVSDSLIQTPFTMVTVGDQDISSPKALRVGMLQSLRGGADTVKQLYPDIEIVMYDTMDEAVKALRAGQVRALLHNSYVWSYVLQKPAYADLRVQPSAMFSMDFCVGTLDTPEGRATIDRLNDGIAKISDAQRQAITLDYTTRRLYRYDISDYLFQYGAIYALVALLIVSLAIILVQRRRAAQFEQEKKMRELVEHDTLTNALSLAGFRMRAKKVLQAHPDVSYVISYNNITNFKYINDRFGRDSGDDLLRFWVDKSLATFAEDELMCRLEADHFAVLRRVEGEERMRQDDRDVFNPVRNYFVDRGEEALVQLCTGIYVVEPEDHQTVDVDHMIDCARVAERRLRKTRKDGYEFYNPNQWEKGKLSADIVSRLPLAIQAGEIKVWYQPQVNFETGKIIGLEALCRWDHGKLGWLLPADFIPALEESGLMYELDRFVWDAVCQDIRRWNNEGMHLPVSVNLARCDIQEGGNIPGHFLDLIQSYDLNTDQLRIEITETAFVEHPDLLIDTTMKLRELGFAVEMDDFGSGYSSLHMLKEVPVDRIKMDLHFLTGTGDVEKGRVIISQVIQMVDLLGMDLIAEGVEIADQARFLQSKGCSEMQGYYFYKPMSVQDLEQVLHQTEPGISE